MSLQTADDVVVTIAIDVVREHVRAARPGEDILVELPFRVPFDTRWLFQPAIFVDHVQAFVAVDVANTEAMSEGILSDFARDGVPDPRVRLLWIERRISEFAQMVADQFRTFVTHQIYELR